MRLVRRKRKSLSGRSGRSSRLKGVLRYFVWDVEGFPRIPQSCRRAQPLSRPSPFGAPRRNACQISTRAIRGGLDNVLRRTAFTICGSGRKDGLRLCSEISAAGGKSATHTRPTARSPFSMRVLAGTSEPFKRTSPNFANHRWQSVIPADRMRDTSRLASEPRRPAELPSFSALWCRRGPCRLSALREDHGRIRGLVPGPRLGPALSRARNSCFSRCPGALL